MNKYISRIFKKEKEIKKVIGITGFAGSGKDFLARAIMARTAALNPVRVALADPLKELCREECLNRFKIDPVCAVGDAKEKVRPFLIETAEKLRKETQGRYFIDLAEKRIKELSNLHNLVIITDIRFSEYPQDEVFWLQKELKGKLIHITKINKDGSPQKPPNVYEEKNDFRNWLECDYSLFWQHGADYKEEIDFLMDHFHNYLFNT